MKRSLKLLSAVALTALSCALFAAPKEGKPRRGPKGGNWIMEAMYPAESAEISKLETELKNKRSALWKKVREEKMTERQTLSQLAKDPAKADELKKAIGERYDLLVKKINDYLKSNASQEKKDQAKLFLDDLQKKGRDAFINEFTARLKRSGRKPGRKPAEAKAQTDKK